MLFRDINSLEVSNLNKECVKSRLRDSAYTPLEQVSKISEESLSKEEVKAKSQQEKWISQRIAIIFNLSVELHGFVSLYVSIL